MNTTIDASVFVAFLDNEDCEQLNASKCIEFCQKGNQKIFISSVFVSEVISALGRKTQNMNIALKAYDLIEAMKNIKFVTLDEEFSKKTNSLVARLFLRGADAIYAAIAQNSKSVLITLDKEMQKRSKTYIEVYSPLEFIAIYDEKKTKSSG